MHTISKGLWTTIVTTGVSSLGFTSSAFTATADASDPTNTLEEVIVTAQRREENSQVVSVAVTAMSGEKLREMNISSAADLTGKVPSLFITSGANQRNVEVVVIRGQGQAYLSPVGVVNYFAEVPLIQGGITAIQGAPGMFFDLESLQVLRGPQGTLFGKNTTGGAVLLGPKEPTNEFDGYLQAQGGSYNDHEYEGALNLPVVDDKLMTRLSVKTVDRDGDTKDVGPTAYSGSFTAINKLCSPPPPGALSGTSGVAGCIASNGFAGRDYDDVHYRHYRLGVLFRPNDSFENYLVAYYGTSHDNGTGFVFDNFRAANKGNPFDFSVATIAGAYTWNLNNPNAQIGFTNIVPLIMHPNQKRRQPREQRGLRERRRCRRQHDLNVGRGAQQGT